MREEANNHSMTRYDKGALLVRRDYLPLIVYHGKREYSYFVTMPPTDNVELTNKFDSWFHDDFVQIVSHIVEKRAILLEHGQKQPSQAGGKKGWYLPLAVLFEDKNCDACNALHDGHLSNPQVNEVLKSFTLVYIIFLFWVRNISTPTDSQDLLMLISLLANLTWFLVPS